MAKVKETAKKEKAITLKDKLYDSVGVALAAEYGDYDVLRVKPIDTPEGVLVTAGDKDFYITITEKKKQIEYETEDVKRNFTAELSEKSE